MHIDARELPDNSTIEGDVCIVGAGAAGISMALDWIGSSYKVILLESGGFEYDDRVQDLYKGKSTGQKYYPLKSSRLSYFGGTTGHWAGMCSPFDNIDFAQRDWVPDSGWPITRKDLDPFYARAHEKLGLGAYNYDLSYWQKEVPNLNPYPLDPKVIWHKMWQISPRADDTRRFNITYREPIVSAKNVHLYTYATAVEIVADEKVSAVRHVTIKNFSGKSHKVKAKHFILAGGAIQNARMLLASNKQAKNGLGNDHDIVGRYFMEHLEIHTSELWLFKPFPTDLYSWRKLWCELAITEDAQRANKILNGTTGFDALAWARSIKPRMEVWQDEDPRKAIEVTWKLWEKADSASAKMNTGEVERAFALQTRVEQAPNPNSRITIGVEKDELGMPLANLHWQLTDLDKRSVRRINEIIGEQMGAAGLGRLKLREFLRDKTDMTWPEGTNGGWHHMGTTRMNTDPHKGVVDANCQVHGVRNLYVAGSGCYATSGAPNPTLTLVALSLRLSDFVRERVVSGK